MTILLSPKPVLLALIAMATVATGAPAQNPSAPAMTLLVDETQAARRIAFVHEEIQVRPGPLALAYPRWIPGEHGPTGPIQQFAVLQIRSGNLTLPWTRDPEDIYIIHVEVPPPRVGSTAALTCSSEGSSSTLHPRQVVMVLKSP